MEKFLENNVIIRTAEVRDCEALAHIQVDSYRNAYAGLFPVDYLAQFTYEEQTQDWRELLEHPDQEGILVAELADGVLAGYALLRNRPSADGRFDGEIAALHVNETYHGQGVGRALFSAGAGWLRARGCHSMYLTVLEGNIPARQFYEGLGGEFLGELVRKDMDGFMVVEVGYGWRELASLPASTALGRLNVSSGTKWEAIVGYSRAVRVGNVVEVAGTTAVDEAGQVVGIGDIYAQTRFVLEKIENSLLVVGAMMKDVVRTRMYVTDISQWESVGKAHGEFFDRIRPVATMVEVQGLVSPELLVEVEVTAIVRGEQTSNLDQGF